MFRIFIFTIVTITTVRSGKRTDITMNPVCTSEKFDCTSSIYWDYRKSLLYYIGDNKLVTCDPVTEEVHSVEMDNTPTFVQPSEDPDCVLIGVDNTVQSVQWDGMSDTVGEVQTIATIDEGENTVISDASTSFNGNLTLIVQGSDANGNKRSSIYGMKTDGVPGRINVRGQPYTDYVFNHMQWNCTYAHFTGNESRKQTGDGQFYNDYGLDYDDLNNWNPFCEPEGSAVGEDTDLWQIMNYNNEQKAEIFKLILPTFYIKEYFELPVKEAVSLTFGNKELNVLFITTRNNDSYDSYPETNAGGLYKVEGLGVTGLPKYIALPEGTEVDYCSNPLLSTTTTTKTTTTLEPTTTVATTPATTSAAAISTTSPTPTTSSGEGATTKQGDGDDFCNCYFRWLQYYYLQYNMKVQAYYWQAQQATKGASQIKVPDISEYVPASCLKNVKYFSYYMQNFQKYIQQSSQANQPNYQAYSKYGQGSFSGNLGDYYNKAMKIINCMQQKQTYNYYWNTQNNLG